MSVKGLPWNEDAATGNVYRTVASPHYYDFVAEVPDDAERQLIVRAVNCHDQLVAALERAHRLIAHNWGNATAIENEIAAALAAAKVPQ